MNRKRKLHLKPSINAGFVSLNFAPIAMMQILCRNHQIMHSELKNYQSLMLHVFFIIVAYVFIMIIMYIVN